MLVAIMLSLLLLWSPLPYLEI